jgi:hypothetical protein
MVDTTVVYFEDGVEKIIQFESPSDRKIWIGDFLLENQNNYGSGIHLIIEGVPTYVNSDIQKTDNHQA